MKRFEVFRSLYLIVLIFSGVLIIGTAGYYFLEDYSVLESFYMTVITISTVGFKEVRPLSQPGQLFTAFLIISSFGTFAYGASLITRSILSGELGRYYKLYRLENRIQKLENHVIICGFGRNGRRAARKLQAHNQDFLVIEANDDVIQEQLLGTDMLYLEGDATEDEVLERAGIDRAKSLISSLSKDADNLYTVITARQLSKDIKIIARASNESAQNKLQAIGANHVVMPEGVGGAHMASLVMTPHIVEFLDSISVEGSSEVNLEEVEVSQLTTRSGEMRIADLELRQRTGCSIIGIYNEDGGNIINPDPDTVIGPNSRLFVLGKPEQIRDLNEIL